MQKNILKKITALIYLITILFSLFFPFTVNYAQTNSLVLSVDKPNLKIGETGKVTATNTSETLVGGETVSFSSLGNDTGLNPKTCVLPPPPLMPSCFVNYNSLIEGTFTLKASATLNGILYESNIPITIKDCPTGQVLVNGICKECISPEIPNATKNACIIPTTIPPETPPVNTKTTYTPLAPLPGLPGEPYETDTDCPFGNYLNIIIKLVIGIAAVLAMVMIVMGGVEYMTSDLISSKESGKDTIRNAILGLLIALGAYLILNTINPQLLSVCLDKLPEATITILPYDVNINSYIVKTSGNCKVLTSGDCSVENLKSIFGDKASNASMICNVESGGIADKKSNSDYCSEGKTTFSFGLFQINLLVHGDKIPNSVGNCANLFTTSKGEEIGYGKKGYVIKDEKGNYSYDCKLKPDRGNDYNKCSAYLKTATGNLFVASKLFKTRMFEDWRPSDYKVCSAAFQ